MELKDWLEDNIETLVVLIPSVVAYYRALSISPDEVGGESSVTWQRLMAFRELAILVDACPSDD